MLKGEVRHKEFWLIDLETGHERQRSSFEFTVRDFDISLDGAEIVFDRLKEESDIVLIDFPGR